ncbi:MAG TPA: hypothetical protein VFL83_00750 [Anaeromyxobacter sp.]|nr:hypothetical protein [Anaeromyxobacter sp.]
MSDLIVTERDETLLIFPLMTWSSPCAFTGSPGTINGSEPADPAWPLDAVEPASAVEPEGLVEVPAWPVPPYTSPVDELVSLDVPGVAEPEPTEPVSLDVPVPAVAEPVAEPEPIPVSVPVPAVAEPLAEVSPLLAAEASPAAVGPASPLVFASAWASSERAPVEAVPLPCVLLVLHAAIPTRSGSASAIARILMIGSPP